MEESQQIMDQFEQGEVEEGYPLKEPLEKSKDE